METFFKLMSKCPPAKFKQPCSEEHLRVIAQKIAIWQGIAPYLALTEVDDANIESHHPSLQSLAMLRKWKQKLGKKATYKKLADAFRQCERQDLVEMISELLRKEDSGSSDEEGILFIITLHCNSYAPATLPTCGLKANIHEATLLLATVTGSHVACQSHGAE